MSRTVFQALCAVAALALSVGCAHKKAAEPAPVAKAEPAPAPTPEPAPTPAPTPEPVPAPPTKSGGFVRTIRPIAERIRVEKNAIKIDDKIFFETGAAKIDPQSFELLDGIAKVINDNAQLKKIVVEGYTDNTGKADVNKKLSQARADAVMAYLVGKGVEKTRLEAKGFGPENPIATNDTEEGRDQNRRVEFKLPEVVPAKAPAKKK